MRWLLLKDLRILRRSPLLLALLVAYPVLVALLVGVGLSSGPSKPRVAFVNLVPPAEDTIEVGGRRLDASGYAARLFEAVEPVRVRTRAEAIAKVRSGDVLGALVIPADAIERLRSTLTLGASAAPTVEVYYAAENPLKRRYVQSTIRATLADANRALSAEVLREAVRYLDLVVAGGTLDVPIVGPVEILGLRRAQTIIQAVTAGLPEGTPERVALDQVERFARLAADNLDLSQPILGSIGTPVRVRERSLSGSGTALDVFGAEVAVTLSLMVVALLLAAGMLALEREENAFGRLVRGLVSRTGLLVEKAGLAALCGWALATVMLVVLALFLDLRWARAPAWLGRAGRRRGGLRRARGRHRRAVARGPGRLAARLHGRPARGRPGARPLGRRGRRPVRRRPRRVGPLPVQAGARGPGRRAGRGRRAGPPAAPSRRARAGLHRARPRGAAALRVRRRCRHRH